MSLLEYLHCEICYAYQHDNTTNGLEEEIEEKYKKAEWTVRSGKQNEKMRTNSKKIQIQPFFLGPKIFIEASYLYIHINVLKYVQT